MWGTEPQTEKCSLLKRAAQQGAWWCSDCTQGESSGGEEEEGMVEEQPSSPRAPAGRRVREGGVTRTHCGACQMLLRRGANPLVCVGCGALSHRQERCRGVSRAGQQGAWRCGVCSGGTAPVVETVAGRALADLGMAKPKSTASVCLLCSKPAGRIGFRSRAASANVNAIRNAQDCQIEEQEVVLTAN